MKRSTKFAMVTVVSLGLVGVVAAKQYGGPGCGHPGGWISQKIAWQLDLNDSQKAELDELRDTMFQGMKNMREQKPTSEQIQAVLGDNLDQDKALEMLNQRLQGVKDRAPEVITAFAEFYNALDAEQKEEVAEMVERRVEQGGRHWGGNRGDGPRGDRRGGGKSGEGNWQ